MAVLRDLAALRSAVQRQQVPPHLVTGTVCFQAMTLHNATLCPCPISPRRLLKQHQVRRRTAAASHLLAISCVATLCLPIFTLSQACCCFQNLLSATTGVVLLQSASDLWNEPAFADSNGST